MTVEDVRPGASSETSAQDRELQALWQRVVGRRSFLKQAGLASAAAVSASALTAGSAAAAQSSGPTAGDIAILRFLAAAEIIESDLWQQYNELGGMNGGNPAYMAAMANIDPDQPAYIAGNTRDEISHAAFINAYLVSKGAKPVSLEPFRTLKGSQATGADKSRLRITNIMELDVDTSWYLRYRSPENPDFGAKFGQAVTIKNMTTIPVSDEDTPPNMKPPVPPKTTKQRRMQAIANSAAFAFAMIEQGGSSLYSTLALQVTDVEVLRIVLSIGGTEVDHFGVWQDTVGNCVEAPLAGIRDPTTGTFFPNLKAQHNNNTRPNNIFPRPAEFIDKSLPDCSIIRPTLSMNGGAMAAAKFLTGTGLFKGQSNAFFTAATGLAKAADAAVRGV
jgi:hypothetical protein